MPLTRQSTSDIPYHSSSSKKIGDIAIARAMAILSDITNNKMLPYNLGNKRYLSSRVISSQSPDAMVGDFTRIYTAEQLTDSTTDTRSYNVSGSNYIRPRDSQVQTIPNFYVKGMILENNELGLVGNPFTEDKYFTEFTGAKPIELTELQIDNKATSDEYYAGLDHDGTKIYSCNSTAMIMNSYDTTTGNKTTLQLTNVPAIPQNRRRLIIGLIVEKDTFVLAVLIRNPLETVRPFPSDVSKIFEFHRGVPKTINGTRYTEGQFVRERSLITTNKIPSGMTQMGDYNYVLDWGNHTIYVYDKDFGHTGTPASIQLPTTHNGLSIYYDSISNDGKYLWVIDNLQNKAICIDPNGTGNKRKTELDFDLPVRRTGYFYSGSTILNDTMYLHEYVTSATELRMYFKRLKIKEKAPATGYLLNPEKQTTIDIGERDNAVGLAVDDTYQYVIDSSAQKYYRINRSGTIINTWNNPFAGIGSRANGMCLNDQDELIIIGYGSFNRFGKMNKTTGAQIGGLVGTRNSDNTDSEAITFSTKHQRYYISDSGIHSGTSEKRIYIYNSSFAYVDYIPLHASNSNPKGICTNDDFLFVGDATQNKIYAYKISDKSYNTDRSFTHNNPSGTHVNGMSYNKGIVYILNKGTSKSGGGNNNTLITPYRIQYEGGEESDIIIHYYTKDLGTSTRRSKTFRPPIAHTVDGAAYDNNTYFFGFNRQVYAYNADGTQKPTLNSPILDEDITGLEIYNQRLYIALQTKVVVYALTTTVDNQIAYKFDILETLAQVNSQIAYRYGIDTYTNNQTSYRYGIAGLIDNLKSYQYQISQYAQSRKKYRFGISAWIGNQISYRYGHVQFVKNEIAYRYNMSGFISNLKSYKYDIMIYAFNSIHYNFTVGKLLVDNMKAYRYGIAGLINNLKSYKYDINEFVQNKIRYRFNLRQWASNQKSYRFGLIQYVKNQIGYRFGIVATVSNTIKYLYGIAGYVDNIVKYIYQIKQARTERSEQIIKLYNRGEQILTLNNRDEQILRLRSR